VKLTISETPDGIKVANCYIGATITGISYKDSRLCYANNRGFLIDVFTVKDACISSYFSEVIINTDINKPDIYQCMKQELVIEITFGHGRTREYDFSKLDDKLKFMPYIDVYKSARIITYDLQGVKATK
jgi:hypothetical protein